MKPLNKAIISLQGSNRIKLGADLAPIAQTAIKAFLDNVDLEDLARFIQLPTDPLAPSDFLHLQLSPACSIEIARAILNHLKSQAEE